MTNELIVQTDDVESTTNFTQRERLRILDELYVNGKPPSDPDEIKIAMTLLNNIDSSTINVAKLKIEKNKNDATAESNAIIAELLKVVSTSQQHIDIPTDNNVAKNVQNRLSNFQVEIDNSISPGVLERGVIQDTYEDFMKRNG